MNLLKKVLLPFMLIAFVTLVNANQNIKSIKIHRTSEAPIIDGVLNDAVWETAAVAGGFIQLYPYNGKPTPQKTEVQFTYDDQAFYVGACIYDSPDSLLKRLGSRDNLGSADYFGVYIDPFNDAKTSYGFFVSCMNVQLDMRANEDGWEDGSWDAVWNSAVEITDSGYVVEFAIPYSALRFPNTDVQTWGVNMFRSIRRKQMNTSWNYIDNKIHGFINQAGELSGIENIEPPLRLSFTPYLSSYLENSNNDWGTKTKGGLDLKYGISESFTLDMMLIPDFGQVQSDDEKLNLSPYELYYDEKRSFFMEGTELFSKGNLFYSRRIGAEPRNRGDVDDDLKNMEFVKLNPQETQIVNATKVTGKFKNGLSLGVMNGLTLPSNAVIADSTSGAERNYRTQALTNYNITVLDKTIGEYSNISLINTNVYGKLDQYFANVTGTEFKLADKKNNYAIEGVLASSIVDNNETKEEGYKYDIEVGKISGNFRFDIEREVVSDTYNQNDLGYMAHNNFIENDIDLSYEFLEPKGIMKRMGLDFGWSYEELYNPRKYIETSIDFICWINFMNNTHGGIYLGGKPGYGYDYFEPRVEGAKFREEREIATEVWFGTDQNKTFSVNIQYNYARMDLFQNSMNSLSTYFLFRPSDKLWLSLHSRIQDHKNDVGYTWNSDDNDTIIFASRDIIRLENVFNTNYYFNSKAFLSLRIRHDWTRKDVNDYYDLNQNGTLTLNDAYNENNNNNFNAFTIDAAFTWNFAPGSQLSLVYKNAIYSDEQEIINNYLDNFNNLIQQDQLNSVSLKVLYYLDYLNLKSWLKKTN